jgi:hypothetical protein
VIKSHHNVGGLPEEMNLELRLRELLRTKCVACLELDCPYDGLPPIPPAQAWACILW